VPIIIPINYDLAKDHGVNAAIVHQQVTHWVAHEDMMRRPSHRRGWFTGTAEQLTELCPLTVKQIRTAMAALIAAGLMDKAQFRSRLGDQTCSYRPVESHRKPLETASAPEGNSGSAPEGNSTSAPEGGCTYSSESKINTPLPPPGGDDDGGMLGPEFAPQPKRRRRKQRGPVATDPAFEAWWVDYPLKLKKHLARQAWVEHRDSGADMAQFAAALDNYAAAIATHNTDSPNDPAPVMHATTFLNGRWEDYQQAAVQNPQWSSQSHRAQTADMDWNTAYATAHAAFKASCRPDSPSMRELLAGQPDRLIEAAVANRQAWRNLSERDAKFAFKDMYEAHSSTAERSVAV
jgi:hypothetical protein